MSIGIVAPLHCTLLIATCILPATVTTAQFIEADVDVLFTLEGEQLGDSMGIELVALADYTGDGIREWLVAADKNDDGAPNGGKIYLVNGATGAVVRTHIGTRTQQMLRAVGDAGDVNGDGTLDYMIGSGQDEVFVHSGVDGSLIRTHLGIPGEKFGFRICGIGDIDGDNKGEVLIGAFANDEGGTNRGRAYIYSGESGELIRTHSGASAQTWFGHTVGLVGDLDGDEVNDYCIGAPGPYLISSPGRVYLYSGATGAQILPTLAPTSAGLGFGSWIPAFGMQDFNGDDVPDFTCSDISDRTLGQATGRLYVYDGATRTRLYTIQGAAAWTGLGTMPQNPYGALGDVDGDGLDDLLVASWRSHAGAVEGGAVGVYSGSDGTLLRSVTSRITYTYFGNIVAGAGDIDGNGTTDFVVGTNGHDSNRGIVYVISGHNHVPQIVGDIDGDGLVGFTDLLALLAAWGPCPGGCAEDLTGDNNVSFADLLVLLGNWG